MHYKLIKLTISLFDTLSYGPLDTIIIAVRPQLFSKDTLC